MATATATASAFALLPFSRRPTNPRRRFNARPYDLSSSRICDSYHRRQRWPSMKPIGKVICSQVKLVDGVDDEACELVNGVDLMIGEGEDSIHAYLLKAVKNNNGTGVLLLSDIFGFEDSSTRDFAYRVACNGYNVLVPDLFHGNPWKKGQPRAEFDHWLTRQNTERVAKDIHMSAKWLMDEFAAANISKKLGIIGFCFGGRHLIETLAHDDQSYFGTGICFYGTRMDPSIGNKIRVPVLFVSGDNDPLCPVSILQEMEKNIKGSRVVIYQGRGHGFIHRPESQEEDEDAEDAFTIVRNWLHDTLLVNDEHVL
ncbi:uncharacterized protein [Typha angustifolia]|uniref:uncharacterized protein isoform X1 n=2 Tax=Typha angustifolia TaxID=59011 RepID=UPI003C2C5D96